MTDSTTLGWVRLHRKSINSSVWKNPNIWMVWSWCLLKASFTTSSFPFNGTDFILNKGEFITGINTAVKELSSLTPQKYRTAINYLKLTGRITIKSNNKFTLVKINKWEEYQSDNIQDNKRITNEQQSNNKQITTYNNIKNDNNDKNNKELIESECTPSQFAKSFFLEPENIIQELLSNGLPENTVRFEVNKFISYWTEPNKTGTKQRWELEKAFEVKRRLGTWFRNIAGKQNYSTAPKAVRIS